MNSIKFCKISIILSVLIFCLYLIAKVNSFVLLPFLPENFVYFICLSIISMANIIILIKTKKSNNHIRIFVIIISVLSAGFFFINIPFNSKREDKDLYALNIQISRYKILTNQRIEIKYIYNNLCAKTLEYQIMPICNEILDNCIEVNYQDDNFIEIQYLIKEKERFIWLYDCSENKIVQKETERLNISK